MSNDGLSTLMKENFTETLKEILRIFLRVNNIDPDSHVVQDYDKNILNHKRRARGPSSPLNMFSHTRSRETISDEEFRTLLDAGNKRKKRKTWCFKTWWTWCDVYVIVINVISTYKVILPCFQAGVLWRDVYQISRPWCFLPDVMSPCIKIIICKVFLSSNIR